MMSFEEVAGELERALNEALSMIAREAEHNSIDSNATVSPYVMRDQDGRFIFLDALVELSKIKREMR